MCLFLSVAMVIAEQSQEPQVVRHFAHRAAAGSALYLNFDLTVCRHGQSWNKLERAGDVCL